MLLRHKLITATAIAALAVLSACGGGSSPGTPSAEETGPAELTVQTFGQFGYDKLFAEFEKQNPGVTVKASTLASAEAATDSINTHLASNSGMPDVVAVEGGALPQMMQFPDKWLPVPDSLKSRWLPWKAQQSTDKDGKVRFYGVDAGPSAICYNSKLIEDAGFPSDPKGFAAWVGNSWESYYAAGKQYTAKSGKAWFDTANAVLEAKLAQIPNAFEDNDNNVIATTNPQVQEAYRSSLADYQNLSAKLESFSPDWNTGVQKEAFATLICPSWEVGLIKAAAPNAKGWNVADTFPGGGANRGGSFLGVSTQSKNPSRAQKLADWLTAPEQGIAAFKAVGSFPSQVEALDSPALLESKSAYMSNAPVGQIYATRAKAIEAAPYRGPKYATILTYLRAAVTRVETGTMDIDKSWEQFVADVQNNT